MSPSTVTPIPNPVNPDNNPPGVSEPGLPPVQPDTGPLPSPIPDNPDPGRVIDPAARQANRQTEMAGTPRGTQAPRSAPGLALPHERDESPDPTAAKPDPGMAQAKRDIDAGLVDTDMRATPGLDARLRSRLVPGDAGKTRLSGG